MIWLLLAVSCSLSIAMIFKLSERRGFDRTTLLTVNYAVAAVVAVALILVGGNEQAADISPSLVLLGIGTGVLFIGGFYVFSYAIREAGMGLATGVMRIAVVMPVLASWILWNDPPIERQLLGLVVACCAFFLIGKENESKVESGVIGGAKRLGVLGLLFLSGGLVDVAMKAFNEEFSPSTSEPIFLLFVFCVAFFTGLVVVVGSWVRSKTLPSRALIGWGIVLGIVNYGSAGFILKAIDALPGPFVFPANNIAIVVGATVLGGIVWGERFSKWNVLGLICAASSLILLWR